MSAVPQPDRRGAAPQGAPESRGGPRRYNTVEMEALPPRSAGRELDDLDFDFDIDADGALELDGMPSSHAPHGSHGGRIDVPSLSQRRASPTAAARKSSVTMAARPTPSPVPRMTPGPMLPPAPPWPMASSGGRTSSATHAAVDPHAVLVAFAGFGDSPAGIWQTPSYALRVIARRRALRADLELARRRRSPDVGLYEASLRTSDDGAVRTGVILMSVVITLSIALLIAVVQVVKSMLAIPW